MTEQTQKHRLRRWKCTGILCVLVLWFGSTCRAESRLVSGRRGWYQSDNITYEDSRRVVFFGVWSFDALQQIISAKNFSIKKDAEKIELFKEIYPFPSPSDRDLKERLNLEPTGKGFLLSNKYFPPAHAASAFPPAEGGFILEEGKPAGVFLTIAPTNLIKKLQVDALRIDLNRSILPLSVEVHPSGETFTLSSEQSLNKTCEGAGYTLTTPQGKACVSLTEDGTSAAKQETLPAIRFLLDEKNCWIAYRFLDTQAVERISFRWNIDWEMKEESK